MYRSCDVHVGRSVQCVSMANYSLHKLILKLIPQDKRPSMQCSPNTTLSQLSVLVPLSLPPVALPTSPAFPCPPQQTPVRGESVRSTACVLHVWVQVMFSSPSSTHPITTSPLHPLWYQTLVLPHPSLLPHLHCLTLPVSLW